MNDEEERNGGQAAIGTWGYQIWSYTPKETMSVSIWRPGLNSVYQKNSYILLFSGLRSP